MIIYFLVMNNKRCKFMVGVDDSIFSGNEQQKLEQIKYVNFNTKLVYICIPGNAEFTSLSFFLVEVLVCAFVTTAPVISRIKHLAKIFCTMHGLRTSVA